MVRPELLLEALTQSLLAGQAPGFSLDTCVSPRLHLSPPNLLHSGGSQRKIGQLGVGQNPIEGTSGHIFPLSQGQCSLPNFLSQ
jgi:hypothetical protein